MGGLQVAAAAAGADKDASARVDVDDKSKQQEAAAVLNMSSPRPCSPTTKSTTAQLLSFTETVGV